jgi:hypothetical protein
VSICFFVHFIRSLTLANCVVAVCPSGVACQAQGKEEERQREQ